jgi:hypothetical protein
MVDSAPFDTIPSNAIRGARHLADARHQRRIVRHALFQRII